MGRLGREVAFMADGNDIRAGADGEEDLRGAGKQGDDTHKTTPENVNRRKWRDQRI